LTFSTHCPKTRPNNMSDCSKPRWRNGEISLAYRVGLPSRPPATQP
jgi:hypothetical protein